MKKTKGSSFRFYATLLLYFLTFSLSRAFYLPGVAPHDFQKLSLREQRLTRRRSLSP
ncbi:unnamed protein product [Arabidopsis halleri]